jgi:hypothetical protein
MAESLQSSAIARRAKGKSDKKKKKKKKKEKAGKGSLRAGGSIF